MELIASSKSGKLRCLVAMQELRQASFHIPVTSGFCGRLSFVVAPTITLPFVNASAAYWLCGIRGMP
jgi:hypothetical protein